jgi:uncharacterized protein (TIGR02145 family)
MAENLAYTPDRGHYWAFADDQNNVEEYGYLYDWETARKVCPEGWHLPTEDEWKTFTEWILKKDAEIANRAGNQPAQATAIFESGFSPTAGGFLYYGGLFTDLGGFGYWWSSTEANRGTAWGRCVDSSNGKILRKYGSKRYGYSVRCIRNKDE